MATYIEIGRKPPSRLVLDQNKLSKCAAKLLYGPILINFKNLEIQVEKMESSRLPDKYQDENTQVRESHKQQ